jgi:hypothetical protein
MAIIAARGPDAYGPISGAPPSPAPQIPELLQKLTHPLGPTSQQDNLPQDAKP